MSVRVNKLQLIFVIKGYKYKISVNVKTNKLKFECSFNIYDGNKMFKNIRNKLNNTTLMYNYNTLVIYLVSK